jgi:hypothetical protein
MHRLCVIVIVRQRDPYGNAAKQTVFLAVLLAVAHRAVIAAVDNVRGIIRATGLTALLVFQTSADRVATLCALIFLVRPDVWMKTHAGSYASLL